MSVMLPTSKKHINDPVTTRRDVVDLGLRDKRGRAIGALVTVKRGTVEECDGWGGWPALDPHAPGDVVLYLYVQAARDGRHFGASTPAYFAGSGPEAAARVEAEIQRRVTSMRKRYRRQAGVTEVAQ